jgi:hypothetical protein
MQELAKFAVGQIGLADQQVGHPDGELLGNVGQRRSQAKPQKTIVFSMPFEGNHGSRYRNLSTWFRSCRIETFSRAASP